MALYERAERGARLADLRAELGRVEGRKISQEEVARRSGGTLDRIRVLRLESGVLGATGYDSLHGLALAYGVTIDDLVDYLDGRIDVARVLRLRASVTIRLPDDVARAVREQPTRWHAATLVRASEHVWHLGGTPEGGVEAFLDELERGIPEPTAGAVEQIDADIRQTIPRREKKR